MSVIAGLDPLYVANNTFSDWISVTNNMIGYMRNNVLTASNGSVSQTTNGDCILNGIFVANTLVAFNNLRGGTLGASANLTIVSNSIHSSNSWFNDRLFVANTASIGNTQMKSFDVSSTSANVTLDEFPLTETHSFKYMIHAHDASNNSYCVEMLCVHDANSVNFTRYGEINAGAIVVDITPDVNGANVQINSVSGANGTNQYVYKILKTAFIP